MLFAYATAIALGRELAALALRCLQQQELHMHRPRVHSCARKSPEQDISDLYPLHCPGPNQLAKFYVTPDRGLRMGSAHAAHRHLSLA
jgi:hypothetical protein